MQGFPLSATKMRQQVREKSVGGGAGGSSGSGSKKFHLPTSAGRGNWRSALQMKEYGFLGTEMTAKLNKIMTSHFQKALAQQPVRSERI